MSFDKHTNPLKLRHLVGDMEADYIYTPGVAGDKFFKALRDEEKFLAVHYEKCDHTYLPPRMYCERCFSPLDKWIEADPTGVVDTFTQVTENRDGEKLSEPVLVGAVFEFAAGVDEEHPAFTLALSCLVKDHKGRGNARAEKEVCRKTDHGIQHILPDDRLPAGGPGSVMSATAPGRSVPRFTPRIRAGSVLIASMSRGQPMRPVATSLVTQSPTAVSRPRIPNGARSISSIFFSRACGA